MRKRIQDLRRRIDRNVRRRALEVRSRSDEMTACLVGYTNAGKSSLMNALTGADVGVADRLFHTLDTRTRACDLGDGRKLLLSDTVGFIRKLPHHLVASFHATLEEARRADLLLHVVDASAPDAERQMASAVEVLEELECAEHAVLNVFNKMDLVEHEAVLPLLRQRFGESVSVSARTGHGLDALRARIRTRVDRGARTAVVEMPPSAGRLQAFLTEHARVISREYGAETVQMEVKVAPRHLGTIRKLGGRVLPAGDGPDADLDAQAQENLGES